MYGIVYIALNLTNNKAYVGQTIRSLDRRKWAHYAQANAYRDNSHFMRALRKYRKTDWIWFIVARCDSKEKLGKEEMTYIQKYSSCISGYNMSLGGGGCEGYKHTEENKQKIRDKLKGNKSRLGQKHTKEELKKMSETHIGRIITKETRKKMSESGKKKIFTIEHRRNIGKAFKGKYMGADHCNAKAVMCIETGTIYGAIREAGRETGINRCDIGQATNGKLKTAGKLHWKLTNG